MSHLVTNDLILDEIRTLLFNVETDQKQAARKHAIELAKSEPKIVVSTLESMLPDSQLCKTIKKLTTYYHGRNSNSNPKQTYNASIATTLYHTMTYLQLNPVPTTDDENKAFETILDASLI
ncbi:hypothetical protein I6I45_10305 [Pseudomonas fluorescens]|nr:hypothetical protein I6I45_10305 [Pseudomonas fluorescens]